MNRPLAAAALVGILATLAVSANAQDSNPKQPESPFGLEWRASKEKIEATGVKMTKVDFPDYGDSYQATGLPKALADQAATFLSFGFDNRLVRIAAVGRTNQHDDYGVEVRSRYEELKGVLQRKYGRGKEIASMHEQYGGEHFALGLSLKKTWLATILDAPDVLIELSVNAENSMATYWRIVFQHKAGMEALEAHSKQKEEDAL